MSAAAAQDRNWLLIFACNLSHLLTLGTLYSFSVIYKAFLDDPSLSADRASASSVGAFASSSMLAAGVFAGAFVNWLGQRSVGLLGAGILSVGLLLSSIATSIPALTFSFGVLCGVGANLSFSSGITLVPRYFSRRRALATGLAVSGSGLGTFVVSQALTAMILAYGWRQALRALAAVALVVLSACALAYAPPDDGAAAAAGGSGGGSGSGGPAMPPPLSLWALVRHPAWVPFAVAHMLYGGVLWGTYGHFVTATADWGLTAEEGARALSLVGLCGAVGRVALGGLADRPGVNKVLLLGVCMSAAGLPVLLLGAGGGGGGAGPVYVAAGLFGLLSGSVVAQVPPLLADHLGAENLPLALGTQYTVQVPTVLAIPPIVGYMRSAQGSYAAGFSGMGAVLLLAPLALWPLLRKPQRPLATAQEEGA